MSYAMIVKWACVSLRICKLFSQDIVNCKKPKDMLAIKMQILFVLLQIMNFYTNTIFNLNNDVGLCFTFYKYPFYYFSYRQRDLQVDPQKLEWVIRLAAVVVATLLQEP